MRIGKPSSLYARNVLYGIFALVFVALVVVQYIQSAAQAAITSGAPSNYSAISAGTNHTCGINAGLAYCWGSNTNGQLGDNSTTQSLTPVAVSTAGVLSGKTVTAISAGNGYTCAVASSLAYCWGSNTNGQLGDNSTTQSLVPVAVNTTGVLSGQTVTAISAGNDHTCAVASSLAYCWGLNMNGRLGDNSTTQSLVPVAVSTAGILGGKTVTDISAGYAHTCAVASAIAACWGRNGNSQLGDDSSAESLVPVAVSVKAAAKVKGVNYPASALEGKTVTSVSSGEYHTCAVASGSAACWGYNNGLHGNGSVVISKVPVAVSTEGILGGKTVTSVSSGRFHVCAVASGIAACWGSNTNGQLGDNSTTQSLVPVAVNTTGVLSGQTVTAISAGNDHTCAVASSLAYCWGFNTNGQLGDNSTTQSLIAVQVKGYGPLVTAANRFFFNANAIQPGVPLSAVNTIAPVTTGEAFRLRTGITTDANSNLIAGDNSFTLHFAQKTAATCSAQVTGFAAVTTASAIAWNTNSNVANGAAITSQTGDPTIAGTTNYQTYVSSASSFTNVQNILPNYNGIWDFSLKNTAGAIGVNYCLKIVYSNGNNLEQYTSYPEVSIIPVELTVGFVDGNGVAVNTPSLAFNTINNLVTCQTGGGTFFETERLRIGQTGTTSNGWNVSIAASDGPTAVWARDDNGAFYDYNDPSGSPTGCNSGSDGDGLAGQLSLALDEVNRIPGPGCTDSVYGGGGQLVGFSSEIASITVAVSSQQTTGKCYWDLFVMSLMQTIPANQPPGSYSLDLTATVVAQ